MTRWKAPYAEVRATALAYVRAHDSQAGAFRVMSVARAIAPSLDIAHNEARLGTDRVAVQNLGVQVKRVLDALVKDGSLVLVRDGRASLYYTPAAAAMLTRLHDESVARVEGNRRRREDVLTRLRKVREEEPVDDDTAVMTLPLSAVEHLLTLAERAIAAQPLRERDALEQIARAVQGGIDSSREPDWNWITETAMLGLGWLATTREGDLT